MKIAIIGSGISGLGSAFILNEAGHDITIYEKNDYVGGHSRTVDVNVKGKTIPVDTGFIVFNYRNYPNLTALFDLLKIPVAKSSMSFGASINNSWLEYGTKDLASILAVKKNLFRPKFWKMILDVLKFNKHSHKYIDSDISLGQCLKEMKMGEWFTKYYLLAMGGAIWSTPVEGMLDFPARTFIRFFQNHGLLTINDQPQWYTVKGGSKEYVKKLTAKFEDNIKLSCAAEKVSRENNKIQIIDSNGNLQEYDKVIFACHSDQALKILGDNATKKEAEIIGSFKYQPNKMILHNDQSFMPKNKKCWASWVYLSDEKDDKNPNVSLSYWMNSLQPLETEEPILVTLNPSRRPKEETVFDEYSFEHPVFDEPAIASQSEISKIQGENNTWFCGAYQRYGFHEDGLQSAVKVAEGMGVKIPWK